MKDSTTTIYNLLKTDNFTNLYNLQESVKIHGFEKEIYQELLFEDSYKDLEYIIDVINATIKKDNLFEKITSYTTRNAIIPILNNINTYIINIKGGTNQVTTFIQNVETLKDKIDVYKLDIALKRLPQYYNKLDDINYLKRRYSALIKELKKAEKIKKNTEVIVDTITKFYEQTDSSAGEIEEIQNRIVSIKQDIEERYEQIKIHDKNIADYEIQSRQNKDGIIEFFTQIDDYKDKMDTSLSSSDTILEQFKKDISLSLDENRYNTELIINTNESIQKNIFDLLGKAIGTNLYKSFKEKVKWMRWQSLAWLLLLIGSIVFISIIGKDVIKILGELLNNGQNNNVGLSFYLKSTLIFPAIYTIYFSAAQFKNTNKLLEEYEFKSAVAVVLHYFKDQVEKAKDDDNTQDFLIRSIEKIFESPTDKVFGRKLSTRKKESLLNEILDFIKDNAKNILPKD